MRCAASSMRSGYNMSEDKGRCRDCGSLNGCQGGCQETMPKVIDAVVFSTSEDQCKSSVDATLKELRACQEKIRKMRHELRCITEAHQRTLFSYADLYKKNEALETSVKRWRENYNKATGNEPNWIRRTMRDVGMVLLRLAQ